MPVALERESANYHLVDEFPDVARHRARVQVGAVALLDRRRSGEDMGSGISELIPVDALSTAYHVISAEAAHGHESPERAERWNGLVQDCHRLVAEWYRKKKPEYFEPLRHTWDPETQSFFSHGLSIRQMTKNALVPMPDNSEEEARRVNEHVEDATPQIMRRLGRIAAGQVIRTVSECTDKAIADYQKDTREGNQHTGYGGYVPEIEKIMVRDIRFADRSENGDRLEEQISLPGVYITHEIIQEALRRRALETSHMNKTELHGAQILASDDLMEFMALLDAVAGEQWCTNIFAGEEVPEDFVKDYAGFRQEAIRRQEGLTDMAETVATFVLDLAQDGVDRRAALPMVENFVKRLLLDVGKRDNVAAEQMFDTETTQGLREVARLEAEGRYDEAYERMQEVERQAPGGGFCGAGSCGLESVNKRSESGKGLLKSLHAEAGDAVVRDKVRTCKCGSKKVAYAYNKRKVNKYCEGCGAFESKVYGQKVA